MVRKPKGGRRPGWEKAAIEATYAQAKALAPVTEEMKVFRSLCLACKGSLEPLMCPTCGSFDVVSRVVEEEGND